MDKSQAICKVCRTTIKYGGSTPNLNTHLVRQHGETYADDEVSVDASTGSTSTNTQDKDTDIGLSLKGETHTPIHGLSLFFFIFFHFEFLIFLNCFCCQTFVKDR